MYPNEPAGSAGSHPRIHQRQVRWITTGAIPIDLPRLDGTGFRPVGELRLVTERSVWLLRADTYFRMPREEQTRDQELSIAGRMDDDRWHTYRQAWWWIYDGAWLRARILPAVGPVDGIGIYTGCIQAISGTWDEVEPELDGPDTNGGQP